MRDPLIGIEVDGRYRIESQLGKGGMGTVYAAEQLSVGRRVAIKILTNSVAGDEAIVERFRREAEIIARLRHPNTLKLIDTGRLSDGRIYVVTELLIGRPFDQLLKDEAPLSWERTKQFLVQAAESLNEAHELGIVHRDIKPHNMFVELVAGKEILKVLDFGIAKLKTQATLTAAGSLFGTPAYMAPEQARSEQVDGRSDLYSLGVVAFQCVSGRLPFDADEPVALLLQHLQDDPPALSDLDLEQPVPWAVEVLVARMLEKHPGDRFANASELIAALQSTTISTAAEEATPHDTRPIDPPMPIEPPPAVVAPRRWLRTVGIGSALLAAAIVSVLLGMRTNPPPVAVESSAAKSPAAVVDTPAAKSPAVAVETRKAKSPLAPIEPAEKPSAVVVEPTEARRAPSVAVEPPPVRSAPKTRPPVRRAVRAPGSRDAGVPSRPAVPTGFVPVEID